MTWTPRINAAIVRSFLTLAFNGRRPTEAAAAYLDPGYRQHRPTRSGTAAFLRLAAGYLQAALGPRLTIQLVLADGDLVVTQSLLQRDLNDPGWQGGSNQANPPVMTPSQLYYVWCDLNCGTDPTGWNQWAIIGNNWGATPKLVLDSAGLPHILFDTLGSGPGYGWCTANCQSATGNWQSEIVEPASVLTQNHPVIPIYNCSISVWTSGTRTALALDAGGNPRLGWDAQHFVSGDDLNHPGQSCPVAENDINLARVAVAGHP